MIKGLTLPIVEPGKKKPNWLGWPTKEKITHFYTEDENGCWNWKFGRMSNGYGAVSRRLTGFSLAHRLVYSLFFELTSSSLLCHKCDNRGCINPDHMMKGTQADNMKDAANKGLCNGQKGQSRKPQFILGEAS